MLPLTLWRVSALFFSRKNKGVLKTQSNLVARPGIRGSAEGQRGTAQGAAAPAPGSATPVSLASSARLHRAGSQWLPIGSGHSTHSWTLVFLATASIGHRVCAVRSVNLRQLELAETVSVPSALEVEGYAPLISTN